MLICQFMTINSAELQFLCFCHSKSTTKQQVKNSPQRGEHYRASSGAQRQTAVTAHFSIEQLPLFVIALRRGHPIFTGANTILIKRSIKLP